MKRNKYNKKEDIQGAHARVRAELLSLYGYKDMLTGLEIPSFRDASYHHIDKDEFGGEYTVENGAMLLRYVHDWLHNEIEVKDPRVFYLITECLFLYKVCLDNHNKTLVEQFENDVQPKVRKLVNSYNKKRR